MISLVLRLPSTIERCITTPRKREDVCFHALHIVRPKEVFTCCGMYNGAKGEVASKKLHEKFGMGLIFEGVVAFVLTFYLM